LAAAGTPLQWSSGETFWPVHPNPLKTCSSLIVAPSATSGLDSVRVPDLAACGANSAAMTAAPRKAEVKRFISRAPQMCRVACRDSTPGKTGLPGAARRPTVDPTRRQATQAREARMPQRFAGTGSSSVSDASTTLASLAAPDVWDMTLPWLDEYQDIDI